MRKTIYFNIGIFVILTYPGVIFIYSFIMRTALICFCTWSLVVAYSQTKLNIHRHYGLKEIHICLLMTFLFRSLCISPLVRSSPFHFAFALLILWTLWQSSNKFILSFYDDYILSFLSDMSRRCIYLDMFQLSSAVFLRSVIWRCCDVPLSVALPCRHDRPDRSVRSTGPVTPPWSNTWSHLNNYI